MCRIVSFGFFYYGIHQHLSCFSWGYRVCFHPLRGVFSPPSMPPWISCLGSLCSPCSIATSIILGWRVPSLPLGIVFILMISTHVWTDLLSGLCKSYLWFTIEYQGTPLFILKKNYKIFANDFIRYIEIRKLGSLIFLGEETK